MGGRSADAFYYYFGNTDVIDIFDALGNATAAALSPAVNPSGTVTLKNSPLLTPKKEVDGAPG